MIPHQARVVHAHFAFLPSRHGVLFARPGEDVVEIFLTGATEIGLFVMPNSSTDLQPSAKSVQTQAKRDTVSASGSDGCSWDRPCRARPAR
jgi:hypothetical protein